MIDHLRVFIGFDPKEEAAFHVARRSIEARAYRPVPIIKLDQSQLRRQKLYWRERGATESTEFSLTRFLCPHLCGYEGMSLFVDCDVLMLGDVWDLLAYRDHTKALHVVQHDYTPKAGAKFLGQQQTVYPRKNWSSVMLFDNARCRALTPEYVNTASGLDLHRFNWLDDEQIGELPLAWNWLIGEYDQPPADAKLLHWTLGGPWFPEYRDADAAHLWRHEVEQMLKPVSATPSHMVTVTPYQPPK